MGGSRTRDLSATRWRPYPSPNGDPEVDDRASQPYAGRRAYGARAVRRRCAAVDTWAHVRHPPGPAAYRDGRRHVPDTAGTGSPPLADRAEVTLTELLTASPTWAYLALLGLLAVDAFVPVVPTQAVMITGGALTVYGQLDLRLTVAVGAVGMFAGDLACYLLGRWTPVGARLPALRRPGIRPATPDPPDGTGPEFPPDGATAPLLGAARRWARARRAASRFGRGLRRPGPLVILLCRFVPGGRMAACFHAGRVRYPARLFVTYDAVAALGWATYGGLVGHAGGSALTQSAWRLLAVAAVAAVVFAGAGWALALADPAGRRAATATPARAASAEGPPR